MYVHRYLLRRGEHHSPQLQRSWDRDGEQTFCFTVIEFCDKAHLLHREQVWINALRTFDDDRGYNVSTITGTRRGVRQPVTAVERMRSFLKGRPKSAEHRAKIGLGNSGKVRSEATKAILRKKAADQYSTEEARAKAAEYGRRAHLAK